MSGRPWTKDEDRALLDGAGVFSINWFRKKAGPTDTYPTAPNRSRGAIYRRAERILGKGGLTRGTNTLMQAAKETGYTREQILRAQRACNQKWKRLSPRGPYLITFEQLDEMIGWLRQDYWCKKLRLYGCVNCGDSDRPSRGKGLCPRCYFKTRRVSISFRVPWRRGALVELVQGLDETRAEVRVIRDHLERGWGLTEDQIKTLIAI